MKKSLLLILLLTVPSFGDEASSKAGQDKAVTCAACHGPAGISPNPLWPNLAGQKDAYLAKQLKDFRSGERKNALMSPFSQTLSDQDIGDLALYFSKLPVTGKTP